MTKPGGDRRRWPTGLAGALIMILAVESFVARCELDFTNVPRMEWRQSRLASTRQAASSRVLGFGTSVTKTAFLPRVVERESGRSAFNLANLAGRMPGTYYLLRRALDAGARPEAIVLEVHPSYMASTFRHGLPAWSDLLEPADCLDLAWTSGDASFFAETILGRLLPSVNARVEIRSVLMACLRGQEASKRGWTSALVRNLDKNLGAFVHHRETPYHGEVDPFLAGMYLPASWSCDRLNELFLRRVLDLCAAKGIKVFWLIPPYVPALQALREQAGQDASYTRFVRGFQAEYLDVVVLDTRRSGYQPPIFFDAAHLDLPGAVIFSGEIGRILKARLDPGGDGPRWVDLPPFQIRPIDALIEDLAISKAAIDASTVRR